MRLKTIELLLQKGWCQSMTAP